MKRKQIFSLTTLLLCLAECSCKESTNKDKIVGKWRGTYENSCADKKYVLGPETVEMEFQENGKCIQKFTSYGEDENKSRTIEQTYSVQGDSIIYLLDLHTANLFRTSVYIQKLTSSELVTKEINIMLDTSGNCIGTTSLKK